MFEKTLNCSYFVVSAGKSRDFHETRRGNRRTAASSFHLKKIITAFLGAVSSKIRENTRNDSDSRNKFAKCNDKRFVSKQQVCCVALVWRRVTSRAQSASADRFCPIDAGQSSLTGNSRRHMRIGGYKLIRMTVVSRINRN